MSKRIIWESLAKDTGQRAKEGKESLQAIMRIWHLWIERVKAGEVGRKNFNLHFIAVLRVSSRPMGSPWAMIVQQLSYVGQELCGSGTTAMLRHWMETDGKKLGLAGMSRWIWGSLVSTMLLMPGPLEVIAEQCTPELPWPLDWNSFIFFLKHQVTLR